MGEDRGADHKGVVTPPNKDLKEDRPMMKIADLNYDRQKFIGSSDVAAILGLGVYDNTALTVWRRKKGLEEDPMTEARRKFLERRKKWEPYVVDRLKEEYGAEIIDVNARYVDQDLPYFAAEIDAEARVGNEVVNVEIKTVSPFAFGEKYGWGEQGSNDIPVHYDAQVRFALGVTRRKRALVVVLVGLMDEFPIYVIERDESVEKELRGACQRFWEKHVLADVPPEPQTLNDLKVLYKTTNGLAVDGTGEVGSKALRLRAIRAQMEALEFEEEALEFEVKAFMKDREELLVDGKKIFTWKEQNWSHLDQEGLKANEKEIYKKYLKSGKARAFKMLRS